MRRLRQRPEILREYNEIINQQLQSGVIEVVNDPYEKVRPGSIHYIPYKEILRCDKSTTRLHIVYDASSKISGRNHIGKYEQIDPQFVREVIRSLYVDDFASGKNSLEGSFELYQKLKYRFREGRFNMTKWASNSDKLMEKIKRQECELPSTVKTDAKLDTRKQKVTKDDESYSKVVLNNNVVCNESEIKVLGSTWNRKSDKLKFDFSGITRNVGNAPLTKRVLLSATARFFDPLGLLSPIILPLKLMFQKACCQEIGWDDPLPNELYKELCCIIADMSKVSSIEIPRCLISEFGNDIKSV